MSYEGYEQKICNNGHYWTEDSIETMWDDEVKSCSKCGEKPVWENSVNLTNGSFDDDGDGSRIDGFIELEIEKETSGICSECGEKHICERLYKIPEDDDGN